MGLMIGSSQGGAVDFHFNKSLMLHFATIPAAGCDRPGNTFPGKKSLAGGVT
jgi:hypothetical protein